MTTHVKIGAEAPRKEFVANGTQTAFPFDFAVFQAADVDVRVDSVAATAGFAVAVAADGRGTVNFAAAPAAGTAIVLSRRLTIQRQTDFQEGGELRAKTLNDELDFQTAAIQQIAHDASRNLARPVAETGPLDMSLPAKAARANRLLGFDSAGAPVALAAGALPEAAALTNWRVDSAVGDGTAKVFALSADPGLKSNLHVYLDGVRQHHARFRLVDGGVEFLDPPPAAAAIEIAYGTVLGTAAILDASITDAKIVTVSASKLTGPVAASSIAATGAGVPALGMFRPNANQIGFATAGIERLRIDELGGMSVGAAAGQESLRVAGIGPAANRHRFQGAAAGGTPVWSAEGSDANVGMNLSSKGTGSIDLSVGGSSTPSLQVGANSGSRANFLRAAGAATGGAVRLSAEGSDANIPLHLEAKGAAGANLISNGAVAWSAFAPAGAVNRLQIDASVTGLRPRIQAVGSDPNIGLDLMTKGGGEMMLLANGHPALVVYNSGVAGANHLRVGQAGTGARVNLEAQGSDANIGLRLSNKGTALLEFSGQTTGTSVGGAGGASALPAAPLGYLSVVLNGATVRIPYYN